MAWVYDSAAHQYRDGPRTLSQREALDIRNAIADGMTEESSSLARQLLDGLITLAEWAARFARLIANGVSAGFLFGRGGTAAMDETAMRTLDGLIATQHTYAKAWLPDLAAGLNDGSATVEGVAARSALYSGSAVEGFERGRSDSYGFEFEAYPGDGSSECGGNCRCELSITDEDEDNWSVSWITIGDNLVCETCQQRGEDWASVIVPKVAA